MDTAMRADENKTADSVQAPQMIQGQNPTEQAGEGENKAPLVCGGVARIDVSKLEKHIASEVQIYSQDGFPRQSERYYKLMSVLHITRMLYHDGHCRPLHREFYRRLAQIHHQKQQLQQPQPQQQQVPLAH
ncbi:hypothetical protein LPJ78_004766 [Coemansia sp. RSA 989]|nr:hypothetical protein LPJ68_004363 [Coemansia sp. RSA 1086]KAJ1748236.1 hypothetical protein LPJ79_004694 [Coemansia sp. RSA 1821]KAJ1862378.1 hypothetical protein LPJ78_004766 [Coemansia sp. RSA 989]KAJ1870199.1 hypothetical protein LPJ55_004828 [Coemansia sp. RSA 990]KAJ2646521.1 hypothetical protein IWW40_005372 [Coemansia sp. RSA 1250]KAJ2669010.1 hypothetical protein IWW42_004850 [Coemansia sp. RSA 1085]